MHRQDKILTALPGEQILQSNPLATVATRWVIIRDARGSSQSILALSGITDMRSVKVSYPGLLVIACGVLLISAAAHYSKDGGAADKPLLVVALLFVLFYFATRKASVVFISGVEKTATIFGSLRQAAVLIRAVRQAQTNEEATLELPSELAS